MHTYTQLTQKNLPDAFASFTKAACCVYLFVMRLKGSINANAVRMCVRVFL
jgi:hypothetical protein